MKQRSYRVPRLLIQVLTLIVAVSASASAQGVGNSRPSRTTSLKLDHFWSYIISREETQQPAVTATLQDQFQTVTVSVGSPLQFLNPAQKTIGSVVTPILDLNNHLTMYNLLNPALLPTP